MVLSLAQTAAMIAKLKLAGYKVQTFDHGWASEALGVQVFRAVDTGAARYDVRIDERIFPDV